MRNNEKNRIELAGLLDGELKDVAQVEKLAQAISANPDLKRAYDEQRAVKSALGSLPEYRSPDFMATRVLGEIAAKKRPGRIPALRVLVTTIGSLALAVLAITATTQLFLAQNQDGNPGALIAHETTRAFTVPEPVFTPQDWREFTPPEDVTDERVLEFLIFANEAHAYRVMVSNTGVMSPDMGEALLVLDTGGSR